MIRATPELRAAAERLLVLESAATRGVAKLPAATRVNDKFRQLLSPLLGPTGFRALLGRALNLAKAEAPELRAVQIQADGSIAGLNLDDKRARHFADSEVLLVAHLLGLLVTFIGEALMLRLVNEMWPKARFDDLDFDKGTNQ